MASCRSGENLEGMRYVRGSKTLKSHRAKEKKPLPPIDLHKIKINVSVFCFLLCLLPHKAGRAAGEVLEGQEEALSPPPPPLSPCLSALGLFPLPFYRDGLDRRL